jgi:hypothetical protein
VGSVLLNRESSTLRAMLRYMLHGSESVRACLIIGALLALMAVAARHATAQLPALPQQSDATVWIDDVSWELRAGDSSLLLRVFNGTGATIEIAVADARYLSPDGRSHRLLDANHIAPAIDAAREARPETPQQLRFQRVAFRHDRSGHESPFRLDALPDESARLAPGATMGWVLYPAEHLVVDERGQPTAYSLFSAHVAPARADSPRRVLLLVPVRRQSGWSLVQLMSRCWPGGRAAGRLEGSEYRGEPLDTPGGGGVR